ncbi:non-ribosomal peptide synthetase [Pedobacter frigidisoli]|uniref:Non-ribosomal peptide synthetase n=1 Tax=Pedobacter frigidisoli TaxID=2530455 RepID=A0A4R0NQD0_9SPHI|nr:non-ribosomal peptide synthetase [Pedobacter frigidisoli]TCD02003.1 non-ribosomal peptide synthetase [Pedobacter frigidisoli]
MMIILENEPTLVPVDFNPFDQDQFIEKIISINTSQSEILMSCLIGGEQANLAYNESISISLTGGLAIDYLKKAFLHVVERHESLRSIISGDGEKLIVYQNLSWNPVYNDLSSQEPEIQQHNLNQFIAKEMALPFDLQAGPLFRVFINKLGEEKHLITLIIHHIICDGWSMGIILEEVSKLYTSYCRGQQALLPEPFQMSRYALEQDKFLKSEAFSATADFWLKTYAGEIPEMNLPTDFVSANERTYKSNRIDQLLSKELVDDLRKFGAKLGCSLVTTMLGLFEVLIYKKTRQKEIIIGLPSAGQSVTEAFNAVGHCVNILPLISSVNPSTPLNDYLRKRKESLMEVYEHQQYSFSQLVSALKLKRDNSRIPLVPVVFNIDMGMDSAVIFDDLQHQIISNARVAETFELFVNATDTSEGLTLEWNFNTQLFSSKSIEKMIIDLEVILTTFITDPSTKICDAIAIGSKKSIVKGEALTNSKSFLDLLSASTLLHQQRVAITFKQKHLTYNMLKANSDAFASVLLNKGIKKGDIIAIAVDRSAEMLVGIIGILKTGAAYLPIDLALPEDRIKFMLQDSGATLLLHSAANEFDLNPEIEILALNEVIFQTIYQENTSQPVETSLEDAAYVLYTSGSTGNPKGVKISHQNLANLLLSTQKMPGISVSDRLLAITTISFDIAILELFLPLIVGAEVVIAESEVVKDGRLINQALKEQGITLLQGTPSTLAMILDCGMEKMDQLKVIVGGEQLNLALARRILATGAKLWNMYGPTETTIYSIGKQILATDELITIGKPIHSTEVQINDQFGQPVEIGEIGEICISGKGVGFGYLNNEKLSNEKFINRGYPLSSTLYKTGDLGKMLEDGEIQCLGRLDDQVKIRGHRIELGEIESVLANQLEISKAIVMQREDAGREKYLVAYIILTDQFLAEIKTPLEDLFDIPSNSEKIGAIELVKLPREYIDNVKKNLAKLLPSYMVPDHIVALKAFPKMPNGKIDKKFLPIPLIGELNPPKNYRLKTTTEAMLTEIWSDCLGVKTIGINDDFFDLGGNSIMAVRMMVALEKKIGIRLPLTTLLTNPTLEKLASVLNANQETKRSTTVLPIRQQGNKTPIYLIHGSGLNVLLFKSIIPFLDDDQPVYGIQALGLDQWEEIPNSIEEIASRYIDEILETNPHGPYNIVGYSLGGFIAFEIARQLQNMGKTIDTLGVVDTDTGRNVLAEDTNNNLGYFLKRQFKKVPFIAQSFKKAPVDTLKYQLKTTKNRIFSLFNAEDGFEWALMTAQEKEIYKKYDHAYENYFLKPSDLKVTLYRVTERLYYLDDLEHLGWDRFAKKGVEVYEIPGDHATFLLAPNNEKFAKILQASLND